MAYNIMEKEETVLLKIASEKGKVRIDAVTNPAAIGVALGAGMYGGKPSLYDAVIIALASVINTMGKDDQAKKIAFDTTCGLLWRVIRSLIKTGNYALPASQDDINKLKERMLKDYSDLGGK